MWGPDFEDSSDPSAQRLRDNGHSFEWVAVRFPGWSLWNLHLGIVPRAGGPNVLALGVHWRDVVAPLLPAVVVDLAASGVGGIRLTRSGEQQADLLVVACAQPMASQILSDAALALTPVLQPPLAVVPGCLTTNQEMSHGL